MSRVQLALRVADLDASVAFHSKLVDAEPAKRRPGYANFAITGPPLSAGLPTPRPRRPTVLPGVKVAEFLAYRVGAREL